MLAKVINLVGLKNGGRVSPTNSITFASTQKMNMKLNFRVSKFSKFSGFGLGSTAGSSSLSISEENGKLPKKTTDFGSMQFSVRKLHFWENYQGENFQQISWAKTFPLGNFLRENRTEPK